MRSDLIYPLNFTDILPLFTLLSQEDNKVRRDTGAALIRIMTWCHRIAMLGLCLNLLRTDYVCFFELIFCWLDLFFTRILKWTFIYSFILTLIKHDQKTSVLLWVEVCSPLFTLLACNVDSGSLSHLAHGILMINLELKSI